MDYTTRYDAERHMLWGYFAPAKVPSFTSALLAQMEAYDAALASDAQGNLRTQDGALIHYYVWASAFPGYYSLGGDLAYFVKCIERRDRSALMRYAIQCIDILHRRICHYHATRLITVALVQGPALGGGFEAALACDVIIAEEQATFGFPEILFNLFPGMGGYHLLCRRIGARATEAMMMSGASYSAQECQRLGIVDRVVPVGGGEAAVDAYRCKTLSRRDGLTAIYAARDIASPISYAQMLAITTLWVNAALQLSTLNLNHMRRLIHKQRTLVHQPR